MTRFIPLKLRVLGRSVWNAMLGMGFEVTLILAIIIAGFLVCAFWWGLFR